MLVRTSYDSKCLLCIVEYRGARGRRGVSGYRRSWAEYSTSGENKHAGFFYIKHPEDTVHAGRIHSKISENWVRYDGG